MTGPFVIRIWRTADGRIIGLAFTKWKRSRLRATACGGCVGTCGSIGLEAVGESKYIEAFFSNLNWQKVEHRLKPVMTTT